MKKFTTYDGRQVMAIAQMTLWVRWAKNDTKSFIFPKLKMISVQNFEDNMLDVMFFCRYKKWRPFCSKWLPFCSKWLPFFHKIPQTGNLFQDNLIHFFINIINITEKNGYGGLYQWPLICFSILIIVIMVAILKTKWLPLL